MKKDVNKKIRVAIGMSGGVDSSVAAALLKKQGYDVVGIFLHFWKETVDGGVKMSSTDLEIGVTHFISAKNIKEGSVAIPFGVFSQIINNLKY